MASDSSSVLVSLEEVNPNHENACGDARPEFVVGGGRDNGNAPNITLDVDTTRSTHVHSSHPKILILDAGNSGDIKDAAPSHMDAGANPQQQNEILFTRRKVPLSDESSITTAHNPNYKKPQLERKFSTLSIGSVGSLDQLNSRHPWVNRMRNTFLWKLAVTNKDHAYVLLALIIYLIVGCVFYYYKEGWTVLDVLYFTVVVSVTVGYGDLSTPDQGGRAFSMVYILLGVCFFSYLVSMKVKKISDQGDLETKQSYMRKITLSMGKKLKIKRQTTLKLLLRGVGPLLILFFAGVLFATQHLHYTFIDGLYWCVITGLGVGLGDITPARTKSGENTTFGKWFGIVFILCSVVVVMNLLGEIASYLREKHFMHTLNRGLSKDLTTQLIEKLDSDGSGAIDKLEWLSGLLVFSKIVDQETIDSIMSRFDELDTDHSGHLDRVDIENLTRRRETMVEGQSEELIEIDDEGAMSSFRNVWRDAAASVKRRYSVSRSKVDQEKPSSTGPSTGPSTPTGFRSSSPVPPHDLVSPRPGDHGSKPPPFILSLDQDAMKETDF